MKWYLVDPKAFPIEQTSACDTLGCFESTRLADGQYRVRVEADGYRSSGSQEISIPRALDQPLQLVLNPARPQD